MPEFGEDPFKELNDVWQDPFGENDKKPIESNKNAGSLLLQQMHAERRVLISKKLEKRK